jgi:hypothetical protein
VLKPRLIFGLLLIMLGVAALVYQEFSYTTEETILQIGALKATAEVEKAVAIPDAVAILAILAGILMFVLHGRKK